MHLRKDVSKYKLPRDVLCIGTSIKFMNFILNYFNNIEVNLEFWGKGKSSSITDAEMFKLNKQI